MKWWCTSYNISFLALSFDGVCEFHLDEIWENCIESSVNSGRGSWCHWKRNRESREREKESKSLGVMILYSANCQLVPQHHWCSFITFGIIKPTTNKSRRHFVTRALRFYHFVIILRFFFAPHFVVVSRECEFVPHFFLSSTCCCLCIFLAVVVIWFSCSTTSTRK